MSSHWNIRRKRVQGERFLQMAGAADVDAARALWKNPETPVPQRCFAARALGLLGKHGPSWRVEGVEDDDSPLGRARRQGTWDAQRRHDAERWASEIEEASQKMRGLGASSIGDVIEVLRNSSENLIKRGDAADVLRGYKCRDAVEVLIEVLAEGHQELSWKCMRALMAIGSLRGARRLMRIAAGRYPLPARQEAIYTLWTLGEVRAESLFIRLCSAVNTEEEYTRDMATEALGNTCLRPRSQRALAGRMFDQSVSIRYAALCAASRTEGRMLPCLREAIVAKLDDPARVDDNRVIAELAAQCLGR